jgi:hypothetical protein
MAVGLLHSMMAKIFPRMTMSIWTGRVIHMGHGRDSFIGQGADSACGHTILRKQHGIPIYNERVKMTSISGSSPV